MNIHEHRQGDTVVVEIIMARIDASCALDFRNSVRSIIDRGKRDMVLDLSRIDFIDSSGLGAIVGILKHLGQREALALSGLSQSVERVFQITRMDRVFQIYRTVDEAVASFS